MPFVCDQRGNMTALFALAFSAFGAIAAIAVDAGSLYHEQRLLQASADLAALSAATVPNDADAIAQAVLAENGLKEGSRVAVVVGRYKADPSLLPENRFVPDGEPANAVAVRVEREGTLFFARGISPPPQLAAQGLAMVEPEVAFSVGSRLASFDGGLANAVLGALLGTEISLSVMDYRSLVAAEVDALAFLDQLALQLSVTAGTYDDLLGASADTGEIAAALASLLDGADRALLRSLAQNGGGHQVALNKLFDLGRYGRLELGSGSAAWGLELSVLDLLSASAALADGTRQIALGLGGSLPGIAALSVELVVGEPPQGGGWFAIGEAGTLVRTAQLRLRIETQVLGGALLQHGLINLPVWLDIAPAQAQVIAADCPSPEQPNGAARIAVLPGLATLAVGRVENSQLIDFGAPLPVRMTPLLDALLLRISGKAQVTIAQTEPILARFSSTDIGAGRVKTVESKTLVSSLVRSLVEGLELEVNVLGLGLSPGSVLAKTLRTALLPVVAPLDLVVSSLLNLLGLGVGEADVQVHGVRCSHARLVG